MPALRNILAQTNDATFSVNLRFFAAQALQRIAPDQSDLAAEINAGLHPPPGPLPEINQLIDDAEKAAPAGRGTGSHGYMLPLEFKKGDIVSWAGRGAARHGYALQQLGMAVGGMRRNGSPVPDAMMQEKILPLFEQALDSPDANELSPALIGLSALGRSGAPLLPKVIAILATNGSRQDQRH